MIITVDKHFDLKQIEESGQCFRWIQLEDYHYLIPFRNRVLEISQNKNIVEMDCSYSDFLSIWSHYFDLEFDYSKIYKLIPSSDNFLRKAYLTGKGIRILNQDPFETTISFIISQQKSILQIKKIIQSLTEMAGMPLRKNNNKMIYSFPTSDNLYKFRHDLSSLKLGYREKYIQKTLEILHSYPDFFNSGKDLNDHDLLLHLKQLPGVGDKIANCIMLFSYERKDAFPIDTWIRKVIKNEYNNNFNKKIFENFNGIIQQYIFSYYRNGD